MWWKTLLLLLLGSPLLLLAWQELHAHPEIVRPRDSLPTADSLSRRRAEQQAFIKSLDDTDLDTGLASYLVSASLDKEPTAANRPELNRQLAEAVTKHHAALRLVHAFREDIILVQEDRSGDLKSTGEFLANVTTQKRQLSELHDRLKAPKSRFERASRAVHETLLTRKPGRFSEVQPTLQQLLTELKNSGDQLSTFVPEAANFGVLLRDLERKKAHLVQCAQLIYLAQDAVKLTQQDTTTTEDVLALLKRYAGMPSDLQALVHNQVNLFAEEYLVPEMTQDDWLLLCDLVGRISGPMQFEVKRSQVKISWKAVDKRDEWLLPHFSETNPPKEPVDHYKVVLKLDGMEKATGQEGRTIAQTPRNKSIDYYNSKRKTLRFNETGLRAFLTECPVEWRTEAEKPREFRRVEHLLTAMRQHANLFTPNR